VETWKGDTTREAIFKARFVMKSQNNIGKIEANVKVGILNQYSCRLARRTWPIILREGRIKEYIRRGKGSEKKDGKKKIRFLRPEKKDSAEKGLQSVKTLAVRKYLGVAQKNKASRGRERQRKEKDLAEDDATASKEGESREN